MGEEEEGCDGPVFIDNDERVAMSPTPSLDLAHEDQGPQDEPRVKDDAPWTPVRQGPDKSRGLPQHDYASAVGEVQEEDEWMRPPME